MILAQKQAYGSMEQNGELRNKPTQLWSKSSPKEAKIYKKEKVSSASGTGKVGQPYANQSYNTSSYHIHTHTKSKQLKDLNLRHDTIKLLEEDISKTFSDVNHTCVIVGRSPKTTEIKTNEI